MALSEMAHIAVRAVHDYLQAHPDAWANSTLGALLIGYAPPRLGLVVVREVRVALGLPEQELGGLKAWSQGKSRTEVVAALAALLETGTAQA